MSGRAEDFQLICRADTNTFSLHSSRNDHSVVGQMLIPMPYPLEDREYVFIALWEQMENGDFFMCNTTMTHPEFPPADGVVQMDTTTVFTVRQAGPRCSSVVCVAHMDMGGSIPSWVNTRITVPTMKSVPISIQQYVCKEKLPLLQVSTNITRVGTSLSSAPPPTSTRETGWSSAASSTTSCRSLGRTMTS